MEISNQVQYKGPILEINRIEEQLDEKTLTILPDINELRDLDQAGSNSLAEDIKETYLYKVLEKVGIKVEVTKDTKLFYEYRLLIDKESVWEYTDRALYRYLKEMPDIIHTLRVQLGNKYYIITFKYTQDELDEVFALLI